MISGRCLCGFVRYEYYGILEGANYCHCPDCRRTTGSAFNVGVRAQIKLLRIVSGQPKGFTKVADSGNKITREFCPECGSPLFTKSPAHPDLVFIKAGTLDNPNLVKPTHQIWTSLAVPWANIDPSLPSYSKNKMGSEKSTN
ncbi:hypothetical protein CH373_02595 [Leptospira perolatii]|uniref:CENP-V/GFA domain-containing protein n=1 Tax=Leptospira perolatii TaxID=2023191 RepID=A0A2M9ZS83_9LEPT|nr:GFA family protein [Leptospira perolatii]PJZ71406.1 hypothetical protein CH360_02595 [Leptospira perolatii]PJZ74940.1 hypothetical protein CH373_02595 [Leptospira perolatii]